MSKKSAWTEYFDHCQDLMIKAESLVKTRINGHRKGLPDSPSYLHSYRVKDMVVEHHHNDDPDYDLFIAALLHDIVEDGNTTFEELKKLGFNARTIELVQLCSHSMEIEDSTERWVEMINRLAQAKNDDAWRIKIADLADNLTESKSLSPENRKFMVEVKAPLLLKLTGRVLYSAHSILESAMNNQRKDMQKPTKKYVITQWTEDYYEDGAFSDFKVVGSYTDKAEAVIKAVNITEEYIANVLEPKADWLPIARETREPIQKANKLNTVVFCRSASRMDTTNYNSLYIFTEIIEVPVETVVNERLFNIKDCGFEISTYFHPESTAINCEHVKPTKCHLWKKEEQLTDSDLDNAFDVVQTYQEESHFSRRLLKCKDCGQLYLREFYEEVDWVDGEDPQYVTYVPVNTAEEAEILSKVGIYELQRFSPRINRDWPKGKPRKIYWIGRH